MKTDDQDTQPWVLVDLTMAALIALSWIVVEVIRAW